MRADVNAFIKLAKEEIKKVSPNEVFDISNDEAVISFITTKELGENTIKNFRDFSPIFQGCYLGVKSRHRLPHNWPPMEGFQFLLIKARPFPISQSIKGPPDPLIRGI